MELLIFGHAGVPAIVFPTSQGRFFEFEDRGMIASVAHKIDAGQLQFFCVDSVDAESWYNRNVPPRWRIARQMQFENYVVDEVLALVRQKNHDAHCITVGASFGGYHAVDIALRHPDTFTGFLSMSGAFDVSTFLRGYYDDDVYFHTPPHYIANMGDPWFLDRYRRNTYLLGTGNDDQCLGQNEYLAGLFRAKGIPHRLDVWGDWNSHDWPTWKRMMNEYL
jgi:esterase/lipase superfamily enzyme